MNAALAVAAGGAAGAVARYYVVGALAQWSGAGFPVGTLTVNAAGSFLMGALAAAGEAAWTPAPELRAALAAGLLGGFTTFSAFALDTALLARQGAWLAAGAYVAASVVLSLAGLAAGLRAARWALA